MNDTPPSPSDREQRLQEVLADYLQAVEAGKTPDRQELLARHPDLADELASFLANREEFACLAEPLTPPASESPTVGATTPVDGVPAVGDNMRYFGDYEILAEIARGGMGVVFKARQVSLNRIVALKMILAGQLATPLDVQRFRREAEAAANLDHPNIVPIYEVNEHAGSHYFSMKLIEGGSLADRIEALRKDRKQAVQLMAKVARAVHYAHQRGILHRDLKPANILLDKDGQPHVTDFGLAKKVAGDSGMTQSGAIVGTPCLHGAGAGGGEEGPDDGRGRVQPGGDPVRAADGPAAVPGSDAFGHADAGDGEGAGAAAQPGSHDRPRSGNHRAEMPGEGAGQALCLGGGACGGPVAVRAGRTGAGAPGRSAGARDQVGEASTGHRRDECRARRAGTGRLRHRHQPVATGRDGPPGAPKQTCHPSASYWPTTNGRARILKAGTAC